MQNSAASLAHRINSKMAVWRSWYIATLVRSTKLHYAGPG